MAPKRRISQSAQLRGTMLRARAPSAKGRSDKNERGCSAVAVLARFRLEGKCILVTGGSRGFGRAIALAAAEAGADVMLVARDPQALARTADEVRERGRKAWSFPADIDEPTACEDLCRRALSEGPPIDILVNNVGGRSLDIAIEDSHLATRRRSI